MNKESLSNFFEISPNYCNYYSAFFVEMSEKL